MRNFNALSAGIYAAESYIGLVEVGVGLLPGGGTKEFALELQMTFLRGCTESSIKLFQINCNCSCLNLSL